MYNQLQRLEEQNLSNCKQIPVPGFNSGKYDLNLYLQDVWKIHNIHTFKDFFRWYNNLDVKPIVEALEIFWKYYWEKN
ncbi:hypothetical protein KUTeg_022301 [Tegillarca granosa]|uniref:Uncharacterized protein n=1 Tax=Tegillarca granosa TaxID=220873 RepID=A0ABQ9EA73_TEGGR|nr:hypothetical protein KUTeg_022301 [Tegillarca granosa]